MIASEQDVRAGLTGHLARLWRYALVLSRQRDTAEELVQGTCVRALERSSQFAAGTRLDRWLFTIMHSIWIDEVRARKVRQGQGFVDLDTALVVDGERDLETRVAANRVIRQVEALPEAQRTTVFLAYVEGFSYREVADMLDIPIGTVMSRLAGARAKLAGAAETRCLHKFSEGRP